MDTIVASAIGGIVVVLTVWFWGRILALIGRCRDGIRYMVRYVHKPFSEPAKEDVTRLQRLKCQLKGHPNRKRFEGNDDPHAFDWGVGYFDLRYFECEDCGDINPIEGSETMPKKKTPRKDVPTIRLKSSRYQPSKAELEEEVKIDATPEELAKAALRDVNVEYED